MKLEFKRIKEVFDYYLNKKNIHCFYYADAHVCILKDDFKHEYKLQGIFRIRIDDLLLIVFIELQL